MPEGHIWHRTHVYYLQSRKMLTLLSIPMLNLAAFSRSDNLDAAFSKVVQKTPFQHMMLAWPLPFSLLRLRSVAVAETTATPRCEYCGKIWEVTQSRIFSCITALQTENALGGRFLRRLWKVCGGVYGWL